jgi:hypothetical protein
MLNNDKVRHCVCNGREIVAELIDWVRVSVDKPHMTAVPYTVPSNSDYNFDGTDDMAVRWPSSYCTAIAV